MSFPAYPKYNQSPADDLGAIPANWDATPLKRLAEVDSSGCYGVDPEDADIVLPVATTAQIDGDGRFVVEDMPQRGFTQEEVDRYLCSDGDILIVKSSGSATNIISGKAGLVDADTPPFIFSNFLMRIRPRHEIASSSFVYSVLRSHLTRQRVEQMCSTTTYPNLQVPEYSSALLPLPPPDEQKAISSFLDVETSKIDALVSEQRRLIELLKEKRQAVISHAVTKGLNPNAPMKPSGIQWLGDVPQHWEVYRMGVLYSDTSESGNDDLPVLQVSIHHGVSDRELTEDESDRKITRIEDKSKYRRVLPNDLVYNMMRAWQGGFGTVKVEGMVSPAYVVARPKRDFMTQYVEHLFRTPQAIEQMRRYSHGVTDFRLRLYWANFKNVRVALPPVDEQLAICDHIEKITTRFDALSAEAERAIELLQERRTALISAAVTGKIDVRNSLVQEGK